MASKDLPPADAVTEAKFLTVDGHDGSPAASEVLDTSWPPPGERPERRRAEELDVQIHQGQITRSRARRSSMAMAGCPPRWSIAWQLEHTGRRSLIGSSL